MDCQDLRYLLLHLSALGLPHCFVSQQCQVTVRQLLLCSQWLPGFQQCSSGVSTGTGTIKHLSWWFGHRDWVYPQGACQRHQAVWSHAGVLPGLVEGGPVSGMGGGTGWSWRPFPTQTILWLYVSNDEIQNCSILKPSGTTTLCSRVTMCYTDSLFEQHLYLTSTLDFGWRNKPKLQW